MSIELPQIRHCFYSPNKANDSDYLNPLSFILIVGRLWC